MGLGSDKECAALESMATISAELGRHCTNASDADYSSAQLTHLARKRQLDVSVIVRLSRYQVLFESVAATPTRARPAAYGPRFELKDAGARRTCDATFAWNEESYGEVVVTLTSPLRMKVTREKSPWLGPRYVDGQHVALPKTDGDVLAGECHQDAW